MRFTALVVALCLLTTQSFSGVLSPRCFFTLRSLNKLKTLGLPSSDSPGAQWTEEIPIIANTLHYQAVKKVLQSKLAIGPERFVLNYNAKAYSQDQIHDLAVATVDKINSDLDVGNPLYKTPVGDLTSKELEYISELANKARLRPYELLLGGRLLLGVSGEHRELFTQIIEESFYDTAKLLSQHQIRKISRERLRELIPESRTNDDIIKFLSMGVFVGSSVFFIHYGLNNLSLSHLKFQPIFELFASVLLMADGLDTAFSFKQQRARRALIDKIKSEFSE